MKSDGEKRILVAIPAYNEQDTIGSVIKKVRMSKEDVGILVIDDGSSDKTAQVAKELGANVVIRLSSNMGYGVAVQTAYKYALEAGYDYLVQLDADGQHDPAYIPNLLEVVMSDQADMAVGSRFLEQSRKAGETSPDYSAGRARKLGIRLFAFLTSLLIGKKITDPTSGYRALNTRAMGFLARDFFPYDYPDADVLLMVHRAGHAIMEIPMAMNRRDTGRSMHRGLKPVYYVFKMFLSLFITLIRKKPNIQ